MGPNRVSLLSVFNTKTISVSNELFYDGLKLLEQKKKSLKPHKQDVL